MFCTDRLAVRVFLGEELVLDRLDRLQSGAVRGHGHLVSGHTREISQDQQELHTHARRQESQIQHGQLLSKDKAQSANLPHTFEFVFLLFVHHAAVLDLLFPIPIQHKSARDHFRAQLVCLYIFVHK